MVLGTSGWSYKEWEVIFTAMPLRTAYTSSRARFALREAETSQTGSGHAVKARRLHISPQNKKHGFDRAKMVINEERKNRLNIVRSKAKQHGFRRVRDTLVNTCNNGCFTLHCAYQQRAQSSVNQSFRRLGRVPVYAEGNVRMAVSTDGGSACR